MTTFRCRRSATTSCGRAFCGISRFFPGEPPPTLESFKPRPKNRLAFFRLGPTLPAMQLKLVSVLGMVVFIAMAWACSSHRKLFPWRTVLWGIGLQFVFAVLILKTRTGEKVFGLAGRAVNRLVGFANEGSQFVFGPLANRELMSQPF